jgi:hypothetical protein
VSRPGTCPVCEHRKAKRVCPAKTSICSVCCGTKRLTEINCPPDCEYLTGAHAPHWEGRESDRRLDLERIGPQIDELSHHEASVFFYLLAGIGRLSVQFRDSDDAQWSEAVAAVRKTLETRSSGVIYEHVAEGFRSQELARELKRLMQPEGGEAVADDRLLLPALRALEGAFSQTLKEQAEPRAFLGTALRVSARFLGDARGETESNAPLIVEP